MSLLPGLLIRTASRATACISVLTRALFNIIHIGPVMLGLRITLRGNLKQNKFISISHENQLVDNRVHTALEYFKDIQTSYFESMWHLKIPRG